LRLDGFADQDDSSFNGSLMGTLIFLHGGGMGGWVWEDVAAAMRSSGHRVLTPTFTGFGDRSHLIGREVTHDVHVTDIVNTLKFEDVRDGVLVAFSYGGSVAPGVVQQAGDRIRSVVYLDGIVPQAGESVAEAMGYMSKADAEGLNKVLAEGGGPVGSGVDQMQRDIAQKKPFKMSSERQEWLLARMSDMPMRGLVSPIKVGAASIDKPVNYLGVPGDVMVPLHARARALGWNVSLVAGDLDHSFIVGAPGVVVDYLRLHV
jgi:pimeloyl-ACP methyl ester carboxylesterase